MARRNNGYWQLAVCALAFAPRLAEAQPCVHPPLELPGLSGPPVWVGAESASDWRPELNDPRWAGAPVRLFTDSATGTGDLYDGQYRLLYHEGKLYVSIQILSDANHVPGSDTNAGTNDYVDTVYFGFTEGGAATGARVVAIYPTRGVSVAAADPSVPADAKRPVATDAGYINWYVTTNTTPNPPTWTPHSGNQPTWLEDVATWNVSPGVTWAVTFKVDLAGANSLSTSKFFVGARIGNGAGTTVRLGNSPVAATEDASLNGETLVLPNEDGWADFDEVGTACTGATVAGADVGVYADGALTTEIQACGGDTACAPEGQTNTFRALVRNFPNAVGPTDHSLRIKFRIADRSATTADWKFAPWRLVEGLSSTIVTDQNVNADTAWGYTFTAGDTVGDAVIDFTCDAQADSYCPKLSNPDEYENQCLLVEVAAAPGFQSSVSFATGGVVVCDVNYIGLTASPAGGAGGSGGAGQEGAGGSAGNDGTAGAEAAGAPSAGGSGAAPSGAAGTSNSGAGGAPSAGGRSDDDDDGCGCRMPGERTPSGASWLAALLAAGVALRSRRRSRS